MEDQHLPMTEADVVPELKECVRTVKSLLTQQSGG